MYIKLIIYIVADTQLLFFSFSMLFALSIMANGFNDCTKMKKNIGHYISLIRDYFFNLF